MSVIYKVITRPTDPRVPNSPKRFYPHLITLGQSVSLKYLAEKMRDRSSLSVGDIKSVIQNFVDKMKEQLLEGKSVNIEGLGVFMLAARSKGADLAKDITAKSVESVRIFFQANKELRITKSATREDEKLDLISLDEYLKKNSVVVSPEDPENPENPDEPVCTCEPQPEEGEPHQLDCPLYEEPETQDSKHIPTCFDGCEDPFCPCPCHLFDRIMACMTQDELEELIAQTPVEYFELLSAEQMQAIESHISSLETVPLPALVLEDNLDEGTVPSEIVHPTVNFTYVAPFGEPVTGGR